jgi:RecA/RadA recombinase
MRVQELVDNVTTTCTPKAGFAPQSVAELRRQGIKPREDLIAGILPRGGLLQILGAPKEGKSILALNLAVAIAQGKPFLGFQTIEGPVLYLTAEGGAGLVIDRVSRMTAMGGAELENLFVWSSQPGDGAVKLDNAAQRRAIARYALDKGVVAITVDPLSSFHDGDENDTRDMLNLAQDLLELSRGTNAGIILNHHTRKPGSNSRKGSPQEGRGSSALHGAVDASLVFEKRKDGVGLYPELRYAAPLEPLLLKLNACTLTYELGGELTHGYRKLDEEALFAILAEEGPLGLEKLEKRTGCKERTVRTYLRVLEEDGRIASERDEGNRKVWRVVDEEDLPPFRSA